MRREHAMLCACLRPGRESPPFFSVSVYGFFSSQCKCAGWPALCRDMKSARSVQIIAAVLAFLLPPCFAEGHSLGIVRLRDARGPFVITVFTSPELVSGRAADISVLIQRRDSNEAVLDAIVSFVLTPPRSSILKDTEPMCGQPGPVTTLGAQDGQTTILARREQSPNKLLYTALVNFPLTGLWELDALVR